MDRRLTYAFGAVLIGLVVLALSTAPDHPVVKLDRLDSRVLESDELYFKNLRKFYYEVELRGDAGMEILRLKDRWRAVKGEPRGPNLAIVLNPLHDEAHLMFQWEDSTLTQALTINAVGEQARFEIRLDQSDMDEQREAAAALYEVLHDEAMELEALCGNSEIAIWTSADERTQVRRVLRDFFNLVGAI